MQVPWVLVPWAWLLCGAVAAGDLEVKFDVANLDGGAAGSFTVRVHSDWAPLGAARFAELVKDNFFNDVRFFRVIDGFMAQFGISGDPAVASKWKNANIPDDPNKVSNTRGRVTFATAGPGTRTTQLFINFADNSFLDNQGFSPFAEVVAGMDVVDNLYSGYGEGSPNGNGPAQGRTQQEGNKYLEAKFPKLSYVVKATIVDATESQLQGIEQKFAESGKAIPQEGTPMAHMVSFGFAICLAAGFVAYMLRPGERKQTDYAKAVPRKLGHDEFA